MSVTTTGGNRLTRAQTQQMPSLLEFYSPSAALLEERQQGPARGVIWSVVSLLTLCGVAAGAIPIDKVVSSSGKVVATQSTIVIQPLETSIVREIDVQEGQLVHKGELLARLDPTFTTSDKTALTQQVASLRSEVQRLQAEANGTDYKPIANDPASLTQGVLFSQRRAEHNFRTENYRQKIDGLQAALNRSIADIKSYQDRVVIASDVEGKRRELARLGWGSQLNQLQSTDTRLELQRNLQTAQQAAKSAAGDLAAMRADASAYEEDWHNKINQELTEQSRKLDEAAGNLSKADLRSKLVDLRADTDAIVLSRAQVSPGSVLQSGDQLFTLVPQNAPLEIEGTVSGADAGFVVVGDEVTIKFDTFQFTQYGSAKGKVTNISADSFSPAQDQRTRSGLAMAGVPVNQQNGSYYRIRISLDQVGLHDTPAGFRVTPGMPVTADILVGKRTVLGYMFDKAMPVVSTGMREP